MCACLHVLASWQYVYVHVIWFSSLIVTCQDINQDLVGVNVIGNVDVFRVEAKSGYVLRGLD